MPSMSGMWMSVSTSSAGRGLQQVERLATVLRLADDGQRQRARAIVEQLAQAAAGQGLPRASSALPHSLERGLGQGFRGRSRQRGAVLTSTGAAPVAGAGRRVASRSAVLGVASLGVVLAFVDATIVNVAFPDIREDFDNAGLDELSWILNAYNIVFAAFLIAAGRFADLLGRRKLFTGGVALFTAASMLCAIAPSIELLIVARIVQGVGAAIIVPASLALVIEAYRGPDQSHGVALWSASAALAAGIGPSRRRARRARWLAAGVPRQPANRRRGVRARRTRARREPRARAPPYARPAGGAGACGRDRAVTLAIVRGNHWGWADARTLGTFAVGAALSAIFPWRCTWHRAPMIDIQLVRIRAIAISNGLMFVAAAGYFAYILCNVLFLTSVWDYSVLEAGLALTPGPFVAAAVARPAGSFAERVGERWVLAAGCAIWSSGVLYMAGVVGTTPDFLGEWLAGMVILGLGAGITFPVLGSVTVAPAPGGRFATASGLSAVSRQLGAALGVALLVAIIGTPAPAELAAVFDDGWYFAGACFGSWTGRLHSGGSSRPSRRIQRCRRANGPSARPPRLGLPSGRQRGRPRRAA